jgi:Neuraminidase (sialidase)
MKQDYNEIRQVVQDLFEQNSNSMKVKFTVLNEKMDRMIENQNKMDCRTTNLETSMEEIQTFKKNVKFTGRLVASIFGIMAAVLAFLVNWVKIIG